LRKQADVVVAVTHLGVAEDERLAAAVNGIDLIIGGHSHTALKEGERIKSPAGREVLICQTGDTLRAAGKVEMKLALHDGRWEVVEASAQLTPLDDKVKLDPAVTGLIAKLSESAVPKAGATAK